MSKMAEKEVKVMSSVHYLYYSPDSPLFCDKCNKKIGLPRMLRKALFKKKGSEYVVICQWCEYENIRVKGEIGKKMDRRYEDYQRGT